MRRERQSAAEQQRDHLNAAIEIAERARGEHSAGGDANEGVNHVPGAVNDRDFVGDELDRVESDGDADDPPTRQHLKLAGKLQVCEAAQQAECADAGVEIDAGNPRSTHRDGDCRD